MQFSSHCSLIVLHRIFDTLQHCSSLRHCCKLLQQTHHQDISIVSQARREWTKNKPTSFLEHLLCKGGVTYCSDAKWERIFLFSDYLLPGCGHQRQRHEAVSGAGRARPVPRTPVYLFVLASLRPGPRLAAPAPGQRWLGSARRLARPGCGTVRLLTRPVTAKPSVETQTQTPTLVSWERERERGREWRQYHTQPRAALPARCYSDLLNNLQWNVEIILVSDAQLLPFLNFNLDCSKWQMLLYFPWW